MGTRALEREVIEMSKTRKFFLISIAVIVLGFAVTLMITSPKEDSPHTKMQKQRKFVDEFGLREYPSTPDQRQNVADSVEMQIKELHQKAVGSWNWIQLDKGESDYINKIPVTSADALDQADTLSGLRRKAENDLQVAEYVHWSDYHELARKCNILYESITGSGYPVTMRYPDLPIGFLEGCDDEEFFIHSDRYR
jgi:hypothetical protein